MFSRSLPHPVGVLLVAALYFGAARLGLSLAFVAEQVSAVWPPTGIALALVLLCGYRIAPGIYLGAFLANAMAGEPAWVAAGVAAGNTLEALVGARLLRAADFQPGLGRLRDVLALLVLGAIGSTTVSATIGVTSLCAGGVQAWSSFAELWWIWWLGDGLGDLLAAPVILAWASPPAIPRAAGARAEALLLGAAALAVNAAVFTAPAPDATRGYPLHYCVFPLVIWAALRYHQRGAASVTAATAVIATWGTAAGSGPLAMEDPHVSLVMLQLFMAVAAVSGLLLAAAIGERDAAERRREVDHAVTRILAAARGPEDAAPPLLAAIAAPLGWEGAALWLDRPEAPPRRWLHGPGAAPLAAAWTGACVERVRVERKPGWFQGDGPAAPFVFLVPVLAGCRLLGVLGFSSGRAPAPDTGLEELAGSIAAQLARFLEHHEAETALRQGEERLRLALESGRLGTWEWDLRAGRVQWSPGLEAIHGMAPGAFGGTFEAFREDIHPDDREAVLAAVADALERRADHHVEYRVVWPDGSVRWVEGRGKLFCDAHGHPQRLLGVCADVTARKRLEEELRKRADTLAEADRRKDDLLAVVAHELRGPLAPILNTAHALRLRAAGDSGVRRAGEVIERQARQMGRLVDDLLDVSRIARGALRLRREETDLRAVAANALQTCRPLIDQRGHEICLELPEEPLRASVDPVRLEQVLCNLLINAARYTDPGGRIRLSLGADPGAGAGGPPAARLTVSDNGAGIPEDLLPSIFDPFVQGGAAAGGHGLGIGLTLVKQLVELHGGTVEAFSEGPGRGSEFRIRLPRAPGAGEARA